MAVEEEARLAQLKLEEEKSAEVRKANLEYIFIAIGIVIFIMIFLIFPTSYLESLFGLFRLFYTIYFTNV